MRLIGRAAALARKIDWRRRDNLLRLALFLAVVVAATAAILALVFTTQNITIAQAGYAAVALAALVAGGGLVIPAPGLATACTAAAFLNPWVVALVAGLAEGVGELTGYFLGYSGQGILGRLRFYQRLQAWVRRRWLVQLFMSRRGGFDNRLEGWMRRRAWLVLFTVSLIPNVIFDFVGVAAGALHYPIWKFLAIVWTGKIIKFGAIAYACAYSVDRFL